MINRILVGAHYGLKDWLIQRATAVIMLLCTLVLGVALLIIQPSGFSEWQAFFANGFLKFTSFIFVVGLCWHAWIGVRDIWMDYVKQTALRLTLMILTAALLIGYLGWAIQILWGAK